MSLLLNEVCTGVKKMTVIMQSTRSQEIFFRIWHSYSLIVIKEYNIDVCRAKTNIDNEMIAMKHAVTAKLRRSSQLTHTSR